MSYRLIKLNNNKEIVLDVRALSMLVVAVFATNLFTYTAFKGSVEHIMWGKNTESLYLMDEASNYVEDTETFEEKVRKVSEKLDVPPEWLMAVMYAESKFNASVSNHKGSGAVGLIQWMPATIKTDFGVSVKSIQNAGHIKQLDYVYKYLNNVRQRYGNFDTLTELYLAILYPRALSGDYCYTLYAQPSVDYQQNSGLDYDDDGRVTVRDIDKHMERIYPTAFFTAKDGSKMEKDEKKEVFEASF